MANCVSFVSHRNLAVRLNISPRLIVLSMEFRENKDLLYTPAMQLPEKLSSFLGYYKRFIKQTWVDVWMFWKQQVLWGVVGGAMSVFLQIQLGLTAKELSGRALVAFILPFLAIVSANFIFQAIRTPWLLDKEREEEMAQLKEDLNAAVGYGPKLLELARVEPQPNLVFLGSGLINIDIGENYIVEEVTNGGASAVVAEFTNRAVQGKPVAELENVKTSITYLDNAGRFLARINHGTWVEEEFNYTDLGVGDVRKLILLMFDPKSGELLGIENNHDSHRRYNKPNYCELHGDSFFVKVQITAGYNGEFVRDFSFKLSLTPFGLVLLDSADLVSEKKEELSKSYEWVHQIADTQAKRIHKYVKLQKVQIADKKLDDPVPYIKFGLGILNTSVFNVSIDEKVEGYIEFRGKPLRGKLVVTYSPQDITPNNDGGLMLEQQLSKEEAEYIASSENAQDANFYFDGLTVMIKSEKQFPKVESQQLTITAGVHISGNVLTFRA